MRNIIVISCLLLFCCVWGSGGYDNGTASGKGKFQLDLTWNPFDRFDFGQTYAVMSYGITNQLDVHGYISNHSGDYNTWYGGIFYQFLDTKRLDLATAVGIRRRFNENWTHIFVPQLLYTAYLTKKLFVGGSIVNIINPNEKIKFDTAVDVGIFYQLKYETKRIKNISIGIGGFHPATWRPDPYFIPTYSMNIKFR